VLDVAFLDAMEPAVRDEILAAAPSELRVRFAASTSAEDRLALIAHARFAIASGLPVTAEMIAAAPGLRLIQKWGIGVDTIDVEAARRAGIAVAITAGANARTVAEHAIALMLAVYRRLAFADRKLREGVWTRPLLRGVCYQIGGKTVGLLGFGNVARAVAKRLRGFEVELLYFDERRADAESERALEATYVSFEELLGRSDILSIHVPLIPSTKGLIGADAIARMKDGAIIINTARGGIVDETALYDALVRGKLHGAGLDVFASEPVDPQHPLLKLDQVVATPHSAGSVFDNVANVAGHAFANILRFARGEELSPDDVIVQPAGRLVKEAAL
jgi:phosphoglycerate dehydrogenase-like enzyme